MKGAQVYIVENPQRKSEAQTDLNGVFQTSLLATSQNIRMWVIKDGFETYKSQLPIQAEMLEIELEPSKPVPPPSRNRANMKSAPAPPTNLAINTTDTTTNSASSSIPPVSLDRLSIDILRALANDLAVKMMKGWSDEWNADGSCITRKMQANPAEAQRIENECEERRRQFAKDAVGLVSDANLVREELIRRIGPVPDEWRTPFTGVTYGNGNTLLQMLKKLSGT